MIGQVQTINGVKQAIPISGAIPTGLPVGTWISFEKDQAPDNKWIKAGETFNASDYPALYLFLGGNVVPERFDHNRLGNYQSITIGTSYANAFEMAFDGVLVINENPNTTSGGMGQVFVDNVRTAISSSSNGSQNSSTLVLRKGQKVHLSLSNAGQYTFVAYYNHPMFIKATSAIEITDQNTFLQTVQQCVAQGQSYSTEETLTGGTWIDGKPIYRKTVNFGALPNSTSKSVAHGITAIDKIIKFSAVTTNGTYWLNLPHTNPTTLANSIAIECTATNVTITSGSNRTNYTECYCTIEYTKS